MPYSCTEPGDTWPHRTQASAGRYLRSRMASPSVMISSGVSVVISKVRRSSLGSTTRPKLSILRIIPVDVLRTAGPFALCKIGLVTGRTHQIRAHLAYLGKPVLGDIKYGNRKMNERTGTKTQALCAVRISFLDVPEENTLHYLSGKVIKLKDPQILQQFDALDKSKNA